MRWFFPKARHGNPRSVLLRLHELEGRYLPSTVTNLGDSGAGSLRQALIDTPTGGTVDFQSGLSGTITLTSGPLSIARDLTIAGPGAGVLTVSAGHQNYRVFAVTSGTVAISGLSIADANVVTLGALGGGVYNHGTLTLSHCVIRDNAVGGHPANGGGIANEGTLTIDSCTITGNTQTSGHGSAGGIYNDATLTIRNSTISGNSANDQMGVSGGGIENSGGTLTIIDSTISGNTVIGSQGQGGGLDGGATLLDTIVAGNVAPAAPDVYGPLNSQGYNLIGDGTGGSGYWSTDLVGTSASPIDPQLGPLQDNGGPTPTMALLPGSPALDAGDPAQTGVVDQRGVVRTGGPNMGAYQASATSLMLSAPRKVAAGTRFDLTVTAVDSFGQLAAGYQGTVTFTTSDPDPRVVLPADYVFQLGDGGTHTFSDTGLGETTLWTHGHQSVTATDTADGSITGSVTVKVRHAGHTSPLFGSVASRSAESMPSSAQPVVRQPAAAFARGDSAVADELVAIGRRVVPSHIWDAVYEQFDGPLADGLAASMLAQSA